jgi:asparagine synthase (glutamine-hydrolysing)
MCGIAGYIDTTISNEARDPLLEKMLESIAHRGPDARGKWFDGPVALGHNRLAIIDLSDDGLQPMHREHLHLIYNGEIYNYIEIKEELQKLGYTFKSHSDSEVILVAYQEWGAKCVLRFVGMWSFAIWNSNTRELFCSRDRFGIKPFYYIQDGSRFYFGSEYKLLRQTPVFRSDLNMNQVARSLQLGWSTYADETYFSCIQQLEAAHNLTISSKGISIERYWDIEANRYNYTGSEKAHYDFRELLRDATRIHMRSDVEVAVCLSGGIDSSSLCSLIAEGNPNSRFHTFSIYYDGEGEVDERSFIAKVTDKYPQIISHLHRPDLKNVDEIFQDVIEKSDVPITGSSPVSHYYLVQQIKKAGIKVVLDGQGADEYLGGYVMAFYRKIADDLRAGRMSKVYKTLAAFHAKLDQPYSKLPDFFAKGLLCAVKNENDLFNFEFEKYYPFAVRKELLQGVPVQLKEYGNSKLDNYLYNALYYTSLPTILHYVDRMTMSGSIESRVPFLDHRLVEFSFSLPAEEKIRLVQTKSILRNAVKDILPKEIYERKDKKGFVTPGEDKWLRGPMKHLLDLNFSRLDFLDKDKVNGIIGRYKNGRNHDSRLVWRLAMLNYWLNKNG